MKTVSIYFRTHTIKSWTGPNVRVEYCGSFAVVTTVDEGIIAYPVDQIFSVTEKSEPDDNARTIGD